MLFLTAFLLPAAVRAHSGAVGLAYPLEGIVVDGDLSDWPADLKRYPIDRPEYGDHPRAPPTSAPPFASGTAPRPSPPTLLLKDVVADRRYGPVTEISLPTTQSLLAFEFDGISLKTHPHQMVYLYRLIGLEEEWRQTREERVDYADLPAGDYLFQVQAVDRDTPANLDVLCALLEKEGYKILIAPDGRIALTSERLPLSSERSPFSLEKWPREESAPS